MTIVLPLHGGVAQTIPLERTCSEILGELTSLSRPLLPFPPSVGVFSHVESRPPYPIGSSLKPLATKIEMMRQKILVMS